MSKISKHTAFKRANIEFCQWFENEIKTTPLDNPVDENCALQLYQDVKYHLQFKNITERTYFEIRIILGYGCNIHIFGLSDENEQRKYFVILKYYSVKNKRRIGIYDSNHINVFYCYLTLWKDKFLEKFFPLLDLKIEAIIEKTEAKEPRITDKMKLLEAQIEPLLKDCPFKIVKRSNGGKKGMSGMRLHLTVKISECADIVIFPISNKSIPEKLITQISEIVKQSENSETKLIKIKELMMAFRNVFLSIDSQKFNNFNDIRSSLKLFFPETALDEVTDLLEKHPIHLNFKRKIVGMLGTYYKPSPNRDYHQIDVFLKKYSKKPKRRFDKNMFLRIFLHEYAHLLVQVNGISSGDHCENWKEAYKGLLLRFTQLNIFPEDISQFIQQRIERGLTRYD